MKKKKKTTHFEIERRSLIERRVDDVLSKFPLRLECGKVVSRDRRFIPERRVQKIVVSEHKMQSDEFDKLFKKFS